MYAIVLTVAREGAEQELEKAGYEKREVWVKFVMFGDRDKEAAEIELRRIGVAQFTVSHFWGRCPE